MRSPKTLVENATSGMVHSATRVSRGWIRAMKNSAPSDTNTVWAPYMIAGPHSMRTAPRSLVARHQVAGIGALIEVERQPLEVGEVVVAQVVLDVAAELDQGHSLAVAEDALDGGHRHQQPGVGRERAGRELALQRVDRPPHQQGRQETDRGRAQDAGDSDHH